MVAAGHLAKTVFILPPLPPDALARRWTFTSAAPASAGPRWTSCRRTSAWSTRCRSAPTVAPAVTTADERDEASAAPRSTGRWPSSRPRRPPLPRPCRSPTALAAPRGPVVAGPADRRTPGVEPAPPGRTVLLSGSGAGGGGGTARPRGWREPAARGPASAPSRRGPGGRGRGSVPRPAGPPRSSSTCGTRPHAGRRRPRSGRAPRPGSPGRRPARRRSSVTRRGAGGGRRWRGSPRSPRPRSRRRRRARASVALGQGRAGRLVGAGCGLRVVHGVVEEQGESGRGGVHAVDLGQQVVGGGERGRHVGDRVVVTMGLAVTSQEAVERVVDLGRPGCRGFG